jgi:chemotaxis protein methyltransferase CheR
LKIISDEELQAINRAILLRYGMDFNNYEPHSFKRRLSRALQKFGIDNVYELWKRILRDNELIFKLIDEITVGLTELFRNPTLWQFLKKEIGQKYSSQPSLSIWHSGCSTGEEVYSMAIILYELELLFRTKIWATDLSGQAIRIAERGVYSEDTFAQFCKNYRHYAPEKDLKQYFFRIQEQWQIFQTLKSPITFQQHNLVKDEVQGSFDLIFCRNVMIYFDEILKMRVLEKFYQSLKEDGYFIIGYYDALPPQHQDLFEAYDSANKVFKKKK